MVHSRFPNFLPPLEVIWVCLYSTDSSMDDPLSPVIYFGDLGDPFEVLVANLLVEVYLV